MESNVNLFFSVLTIIAQIIILGFLLNAVLFRRFQPQPAWASKLINFFAKNMLLFSFIISLVATLGSLFYSEILNYEPCKLCWFQRIFMYPQVLILGMALVFSKGQFASGGKNKNAGAYSILLSIIGAIIAGYHYLLQIGAAPPTSCELVGYSVDCSQYFTMNFGYITLPMMSFTAFLLIIILIRIGNIYLKKEE